jgi:hypothetical protein
MFTLGSANFLSGRDSWPGVHLSLAVSPPKAEKCVCTPGSDSSLQDAHLADSSDIQGIAVGRIPLYDSVFYLEVGRSRIDQASFVVPAFGGRRNQ